MLRLTYPDGTVAEADDAESQKRLLDAADPNRVHTVESMAERLKISERSAYELIRSGKIPYACLGKKNYRVAEFALLDYLRTAQSYA